MTSLQAIAQSIGNAKIAETDEIEDVTLADVGPKQVTLKQVAHDIDADGGVVGEDIKSPPDADSQPPTSLKSVASAQRMSLADFAKQQQQNVSTPNAGKPSNEPALDRPGLIDVAKSIVNEQSSSRVSLMDVANSKRSSLLEVATSRSRTSLLESVQKQQVADGASLVEIAKANKAKQTSTVAKVLGSITREESQVIGNHIEATMKQVRDEVRREQNQDAHDALQSAVRDVQYEDEFDYESSADKINRAVDILVQKAQQPADLPLRPTMSVDRDVLRSRQGRGLQHTGPTVKSRQNKLSSHQLNQLTETQKRLLYATLVEHKSPNNRQRDNQAHMEYINRIAKPVKPKNRRGKEQYARESDRRHCKFKPRVGRGSAESGRRSDDDDDDDNAKDNQDFIRRMEAAEKAKLDGIQRQRAERVYLAKLDKKECPKCGNPQSYSEVQQKRKQCPNCGVTYRSRLAWGDISSEFFERVDLSEEQRVRHLEQLSADRTPCFRVSDKRVFDKRHNRMVRAKPLTWEEVELDFLTRVQLDATNRITNRQELEQKFYGSFTYHPHITALAKRMDYIRFEDRMQQDIDQRVVRQEQNQITAESRALYRSSTTM